jgi:hypothetical protein
MPRAWTVPAGSDLWQVVSRSSVLKADEDSAGGTNETNSLNPDGNLDTRASKAVENVVKEVRGAIESAGRYAVSVTASSVPPEGVEMVLAAAAYRLCMPKPSLLAVVMGDGGIVSPINRLYKEYTDWLKCLREGGSFTEPTDPTGQDYTTAVGDTNLAISGVRWGDSLADGDEYDAGITSDGIVVSRLSQNMNTN